MADPLNITRWPVFVNPVTGVALSKLQQRLSVMEHEVLHLRTAVMDMRNGLQRNDTKLLTSGVMNSRNWTLSAVMSHCYVQVLLGKNSPGSSGFNDGTLSPMSTLQADILFARASKHGADEGMRDRA